MNTLTISRRITLEDYQHCDPARTEPNFSAQDADAYVTWLNTQHDGHTYRLPTSQEYDDLDLNVASWEWTSDTEGPYRAVRGGSFVNYEWDVRAASSGGRYPNFRSIRLGFRVVVS